MWYALEVGVTSNWQLASAGTAQFYSRYEQITIVLKEIFRDVKAK